MNGLFLLHLLCTAYMTGIVWFVQVVHYHDLDLIPEELFVAAHKRYTSVMGALVAPVMLVEAVTGVLLCFNTEGILPLVGGVLLAVVWWLTFARLVPCHQKLLSGYRPELRRRLLRWNAWRTAAWTLRVLVLSAWGLW